MRVTHRLRRAGAARDIAGQLISSRHVTNTHRAALGARVATVTGADGSPPEPVSPGSFSR